MTNSFLAFFTLLNIIKFVSRKTHPVWDYNNLGDVDELEII